MKVYVYHKEFMKDKQTDLLIGVCDVDMTVLTETEGMSVLDGYYKLHNPDYKEELGVLKIKIVPSNSFKKIIGIDRQIKFESPKIEGVLLEEIKSHVFDTLKQVRGGGTFEKYDKHLESIAKELSEEESEDLLKRHMQNLKELDALNKKLKGEVEDPEQTIKPSNEPLVDSSDTIKVQCEVKAPESSIAILEDIHIRKPIVADKELKEEVREIAITHEPVIDLNIESKQEVIQEANIKKKPQYELEIKGNTLREDAKDYIPKEKPQEELKLEPRVSSIKELSLKPIASPKEQHTEKEIHIRREDLVIEEKKEEVKAHVIDRKKLLSTPHKKPPLPRHLSSNIKHMTGADLKDKELERITKIMRESPTKTHKKYYDYSSDSDS
jgi:hypothetical protein